MKSIKRMKLLAPITEIFGVICGILIIFWLGRQVMNEELSFGVFAVFLGAILSVIRPIKKMGNVKDLVGMIPGMGKAMKDVDIDDDAFKSIEAIIFSMTPEERTNPALLNGSRRKRIAFGSGTNIQEVNRLIKQFDETRKMMRMFSGGKNMTRMMSNMNQMRKKRRY